MSPKCFYLAFDLDGDGISSDFSSEILGWLPAALLGPDHGWEIRVVYWKCDGASS